ncbi:MAG: M50 family metallopeptidase [Solirubrobacterales bacterium]
MNIPLGLSISGIGPWLLVFAGFIVLIVMHEFGHFVVAKWTGMRVERFFLFFPPKLVSVRRGETEYGIGAIPLGGFVKITGMNPEELEAAERGEQAEHKPGLLEQLEGADSGTTTPESIEAGGRVDPEILRRAYYNQPVWKRVVVIAAGPAMNLLIAFFVLFFLALGTEKPTQLTVDSVQADTPAAKVLQPGDRIVSVDGVRPTRGGSNPSTGDLDARAKAIQAQVNTHHCAGKPVDHCLATTPITLVVVRDGKRVTLHATPFYDAKATDASGNPDPRYRLGFGFGVGGFVAENLSVPEAAGRSVSIMADVTARTVSTFVRLFEPEQRKQVSGVVGVSDVAHQTIEHSARDALLLLAIVSLSLAIINLFPFLPLDGGHIFWSLVEKVRGSRVPFSVIERASAIGFLLILMLFVIGLTNDINRLTGQGFNVR